MFNQMRQLPQDVVDEWDKGQPEFQPFQQHLRDIRLMNEARNRFWKLCAAGVGVVFGFGAGLLGPLYGIVVGALLVLALGVQGGVWLRRFIKGMEVSRKMDEGIKIVDPEERKQHLNGKKEKAA